MRKYISLPALLFATTAHAQIITPAQGTLTDTSGNVWQISPSGSIQENLQWTPGGGGTSRLTIQNGTVYGEDSTGRGWFTFGQNYWTSTSVSPVAAAVTQTIQPTAAQTQTAAMLAACNAIPKSSAFGIMNGVIYDSNQQPIVPKGIDIVGNPSAATILASFPGTQIVRYPIFHYESSATLAPYINDLTSHGLIVILEDHHDNNPGASNAGGAVGTIFTGADLAAELAWHVDISTAFKNNPLVWQATKNEPPEATTPGGQNNAAALSAWQLQEYNAIRGTGNNNPILLEMNSWGVGMTGSGYDPAVYAKMNNTIWDIHWYGWIIPDQIGGHANYGMNQSVADATLKAMVDQAQAIKGAGGQTMPVFLGEIGNAAGDYKANPAMGVRDPATGDMIDRNWQQTLNTAFTSGYGYAAWAWGVGPGDRLTVGDQPTNGFGTMVAADIAKGGTTNGSPAPSCANKVMAQANPPPVTGPVGNPLAQAQPTPPLPDDPATIAINNQIAAMQAQVDATQAQIKALDPSNIANKTVTDALADGDARMKPGSQQ